jgi:LysM repeat protein
VELKGVQMAKKIKTKGNTYGFSNSALSSKQKRKFNLISGIKKIALNIFEKAIIIKDKLVDFNINSDKKAKELKDRLIAFNIESDKKAKELFETISETACTKDVWNLRTVGNNILAKKVFIKHFTVVFVTLTIIFMIVQFGFRPVVVVSIKDQPVAVVPTKKDFENVLASVQSKWGRLYSKEIKLNDAPLFSLKVLPKRMISTPAEVANAIEANTNLLVAASGISVNGEVVAVLRDVNEAQVVLDTIKKKFSSQKAGEEVVFCDDVKVVSTFALPDIMLGTSKAVEYLTKNIDVDKEYTVKMGDTLWNIAEDNNMAVEKLCELNPQIQDDIYPGQVIKLATPNCLVDVKTIQYLETKEDTPFETKFESDEKATEEIERLLQKVKPAKRN